MHTCQNIGVDNHLVLLQSEEDYSITAKMDTLKYVPNVLCVKNLFGCKLQACNFLLCSVLAGVTRHYEEQISSTLRTSLCE